MMIGTRTSLCGRLGERLSHPLPGRSAQMTMVPTGRSVPDRAPENAREGAVLIALLPTTDGFALPLIERSDDGGPHARQIALPGGAREPEDTFPVGTALREAEEEIGLAGEGLTVIGTLTPLYIAVSNFVISPLIACGSGLDPSIWEDLRPDHREVRRILGVDPLTLEATRAHREVVTRGARYTVPSYEFRGEVIWGATAIILAELCALLG